MAFSCGAVRRRKNRNDYRVKQGTRHLSHLFSYVKNSYLGVSTKRRRNIASLQSEKRHIHIQGFYEYLIASPRRTKRSHWTISRDLRRLAKQVVRDRTGNSLAGKDRIDCRRYHHYPRCAGPVRGNGRTFCHVFAGHSGPEKNGRASYE